MSEKSITKQKGPGRPFEKGTSPNPGGRPKVIREALEAFRDPNDLAKLRQRLIDIALDTDGDSKASIAAIKEWHDRAYGKAPQAITGEDGKPLSMGIVVLPMMQLDALPALEESNAEDLEALPGADTVPGIVGD